MKHWFSKLKELSQLILVMISMAFVIALIDPNVRTAFMELVGKVVEAVSKSVYWIG